MSGFSAGLGRSEKADTSAAVSEALAQASATLGGEPEFAFVTCTVDHDAAKVHRAVREALPNVEIHGITSSLGVLGTGGITMGADGAVGIMLARGDGRSFLCAGAEVGDDPKAAGVRAATTLLEKSGGRRPRALFFNASPGAEEDLLDGVASVLPGIPAYGGSSADHAISGDWRVFTNEGTATSAVSLAGIFDGPKIGASFLAPYEPTAPEVRVTTSAGRRISSLGDRRAAEVLGDWVGDAIATQAVSGGNVLAQTALSPIGVRRDGSSGAYYVPVHPAQIHVDGSIDVFARAPAGSTVCRMTGTVDGLIDVLPKLLDAALEQGGMREADVKAGMLIYCAGCAGSVGDRLHDGLRKHLGSRLGGAALLGLCTFGEQGWVAGLGNLHANLSLGLVLLG